MESGSAEGVSEAGLQAVSAIVEYVRPYVGVHSSGAQSLVPYDQETEDALMQRLVALSKRDFAYVWDQCVNFPEAVDSDQADVAVAARVVEIARLKRNIGWLEYMDLSRV